MDVVPIDKTKGSRKVFTCPHQLAAEIDAWRSEQRPIPPESQAVVQLLRLALQRWREEQQSKPRRTP